MEKKFCKKCNKEKNIDEFIIHKYNGKNYYYMCKDCNRKKAKKYYNENKKIINEKAKEKRLNYSIEKKNEISIKRKIYTDNHKEEKRDYDIKYRKNNRRKITSRQNSWKKEKIKNDEVFKLKENIKNIIYYSFNRKQKYRENGRAYNIFGCNWETFYNHLLQTYKNRYGYEYNETEQIHIDHIIPLITAKTKEEVIKLNHYTNLQLLKPEDNIKKGTKII